ncbi:hypothetical protein [Hymenobacter siberiensis]|uniref:hypothetical protein n=1 Tax=Hymenobacter siberiensis TaxID=2848396 RepID=UPI001C1E0350|nr:hypothetical protein [Hymenobacter siberiensis]
MATKLTPAQIAKAAASMPSAADYTKIDASRQGYASPLPFDSYSSSIDAAGAVEKFGFNPDGTPKLAVYRGDTRDGAHKAGDPVMGNDGKQVNEATGLFILDGHGQKIRLYDSVLRRLAVSVKPEDRKLWDALTTGGTHGPVFSGAVEFAVVVDQNGDRPVPRIVEA